MAKLISRRIQDANASIKDTSDVFFDRSLLRVFKTRKNDPTNLEKLEALGLKTVGKINMNDQEVNVASYLLGKGLETGNYDEFYKFYTKKMDIPVSKDDALEDALKTITTKVGDVSFDDIAKMFKKGTLGNGRFFDEFKKQAVAGKDVDIAEKFLNVMCAAKYREQIALQADPYFDKLRDLQNLIAADKTEITAERFVLAESANNLFKNLGVYNLETDDLFVNYLKPALQITLGNLPNGTIEGESHLSDLSRYEKGEITNSGAKQIITACGQVESALLASTIFNKVLRPNEEDNFKAENTNDKELLKDIFCRNGEKFDDVCARRDMFADSLRNYFIEAGITQPIQQQEFIKAGIKHGLFGYEEDSKNTYGFSIEKFNAKLIETASDQDFVKVFYRNAEGIYNEEEYNRNLEAKLANEFRKPEYEGRDDLKLQAKLEFYQTAKPIYLKTYEGEIVNIDRRLLHLAGQDVDACGKPTSAQIEATFKFAHDPKNNAVLKTMRLTPPENIGTANVEVDDIFVGNACCIPAAAKYARAASLREENEQASLKNRALGAKYSTYPMFFKDLGYYKDKLDEYRRLFAKYGPLTKPTPTPVETSEDEETPPHVVIETDEEPEEEFEESEEESEEPDEESEEKSEESEETDEELKKPKEEVVEAAE